MRLQGEAENVDVAETGGAPTRRNSSGLQEASQFRTPIGLPTEFGSSPLALTDAQAQTSPGASVRARC